MMEYHDLKIQLVDVPSLFDESARGWLINVVRNADALLLIVDLSDGPEITGGTVAGRTGKI